MTKTKDIGNFGETAAAKYLLRNHYKILARNFRDGHHELDIVAQSRTDIVFVEVKTRTVDPDAYSPYGTPSEAVDRDKKRNTLSASYAYLRQFPNSRQPRVDVIEVYLDKSSEKPKVLKINHFENAIGKNDI